MGAWTQSAVRHVKFGTSAARAWPLLAWPFGLFLALWFRLIRWTSVIEERGPGAAFSGPAVYVNWHRHLPYLIVHHGERGRWMMVSRAPYMEPVALWCRLMGLRLSRGATGDAGREALAELRESLQRGDSVVLAVDGPAGPAFQVKPGCVKLARSTGVPIIPVAYHSRRGREVTRRWDRMLLVRPFDRIVLEYGNPLVPGPELDSVVQERISETLRALDSGLRDQRS